jgi:hypothetical protein
VVNNDGLISATKECIKPEATSSVDRTTMVFYSYPKMAKIFTVCLQQLRRYKRLSLAENGGMRYLAARGLIADPKDVTIQSNSNLAGSDVELFRLFLIIQKSLESFDFSIGHANFPLRFSGTEIP